MFYNAAMSVDRDLAVAVARAWSRRAGPGRSGWDMLAATGARGLRMLAESDLFARQYLTEMQPAALEVLRANAAPFADRGAIVRSHDSRRPLAEGPFDFVDVDPYGSPMPFLGAAMDSLVVGGWLAVTATDMMVLAGVVAGACERRYSAHPMRGRLASEAGLRILLASISRSAAERGRRMHVQLAYVRDHHVRAYVSVEPGADPGAPIASIEPDQWTGPRLPGKGPYGPLWLGHLFDAEFVRELVVPPTASRPRELAKLIETFQAEASVDHPFFYESNELARALRLPSPPSRRRLLEALVMEGFAAGVSHMRRGAIRTSAPRTEVERIARAAA